MTPVSLYKSTEHLCFDFESSSAAFFIRSLGFQSHFPLGVTSRERVNENKTLNGSKKTEVNNKVINFFLLCMFLVQNTQRLCVLKSKEDY